MEYASCTVRTPHAPLILGWLQGAVTFGNALSSPYADKFDKGWCQGLEGQQQAWSSLNAIMMMDKVDTHLQCATPTFECHFR